MHMHQGLWGKNDLPFSASSLLHGLESVWKMNNLPEAIEGVNFDFCQIGKPVILLLTLRIKAG